MAGDHERSNEGKLVRKNFITSNVLLDVQFQHRSPLMNADHLVLTNGEGGGVL